MAYWLLFFSLGYYRYLGDSGTDRREILHDGRGLHVSPGQVFSPFGGGNNNSEFI